MNIIKARKELSIGKSIYDMNLRVVNYDRVSTDKDEQLNSLMNQANYFNDMIADVKNWHHVGTYTDEGISGTQVHKRENFLRMIEDARLGKFDLIVTKEISRFARNTIDSIKYTQMLLSYGVIVFFISDNINTINPDSEFRLTLMASMAQDEVRKLSERVKFGIRRSIKDGKVGGGNLYGYNKKNCKLTINEEEAPIVKKIFTLYSSGEYGFRKIGEMLANEGHYTKSGKVFSDVTLKKMIKNPRYKGWYTANLSEVEDYKTHKKVPKPKEEWVMYKDESGNVPAIIDEDLWDKANAIHDERMKRWNKNVLNKKSFLENRNYTSKIFCLEHNSTFIRSASGKRKNNPVWQCNEFLRHGIKGCATPRLYEKYLDEIFSTMMEKIMDDKEMILNNITNDYVLLIKESNSTYDYENLNIKLKEKQMFKDKLLDMLLKNIISDEDFMKKNKILTDEINELNKQILIIESNKESTTYYDNIISKIRANLIPKMDIKKNIGKYFNLFIDKVFVSKINNDRKHLKLQMTFNFKNDDEEIEIDMNEKSNDNDNDKYFINKVKNNVGVLYDTNFLKQKYLLFDSNEPWICQNGLRLR